MPTYTQANQPLAIETPLGPDKLLLARLVGTEAISQLFHFSLDCLARAPISFDDLLGQPATVRLTIPGCPQRYVNGIVSGLEQGHQSQGAAGGVTFYRYKVELVPRLWLCGLRRQSRVFQQQAVPDILRAVLHDDWGFDVQSRLSGTYPARDYCTQYRETDLDFVKRLMEEEGICFFFLHAEKSHTLVLADGTEGHPDLDGPSGLIFDAAAGGRRPEGRVTTWKKKQSLRPCKVTLRDACFQLPTSTLQASSTIQESVAAGQKSHTLRHSVMKNGNDLLEQYDHLGGYAWRFDGVSPEGNNQPEKVQGLFKENQRVTDLRAQAEAAAALTIDGASLCGHLLPGCRFSLARHFDGDGDYLLTRVDHKADLESAYLSDNAEAGLLYENQFGAIPAGLPYRPPVVTLRPRAHGVINALVVGPKGGDIFVDRYGRVKVKFFWDREEATGPQNSCWLRVGQVWAGNRWGAFFWPRVGHEVIVTFLDGDPDRPLITGSVYNENHMPPFELPANKMLAGIKSNTSSGGDGSSDPMVNYSGWVINDDPGKEILELHGEKHIALFAEYSEKHMVDGPHRLNVNGIHSVHVGAIPGGSGSGGSSGGGVKDNNQPYVFQTGTEGGSIGAELSSVCGVNQGVNLGLYSTLTVGQYLNVVANPLGMMADLGWKLPGSGMVEDIAGAVGAGVFAAAGGVLGGYLNITMGSQVQLNYGTNITISRGAKASISEVGYWNGGPMETGEDPMAFATCAMAGVCAAFITGGTIWACLDAYQKDQAVWLSFLGLGALGTTVLTAAEVFRVTYNQVQKAKEAAFAATSQNADSDMIAAVAEVTLALFGGDDVNRSEAKLTKGNTAEYNDNVRIVGADTAIMLFSGRAVGTQSIMVTTPAEIIQMSGVKDVGPRLNLDSLLNKITLAIGPAATASSLTMTPASAKLQVGPDSSITLTDASIILEVGDLSITMSEEEGIFLESPTGTLRLLEGIDLTTEEAISMEGSDVSIYADEGSLTIAELEIDSESVEMM